MVKRVALLGFILAGLGIGVSQPASAQDGYYGSQNRYYQNDRAWSTGRGQRGDFDPRAQGWREGDRRAEERRERDWRRREWREQQWRDRQTWNNRYYRNNNPGSYFYFGFGR
ncbi:MAG: hypothetical protein ACJ74Y_04255 [Bryobacteraceae bacterium]